MRLVWFMPSSSFVAEGLTTFEMTGSAAPSLIALLAPILSGVIGSRRGGTFDV